MNSLIQHRSPFPLLPSLHIPLFYLFKNYTNKYKYILWVAIDVYEKMRFIIIRKFKYFNSWYLFCRIEDSSVFRILKNVSKKMSIKYKVIYEFHLLVLLNRIMH